MRKIMSLILCQAIALATMAQDVSVTLSEPGTLAQELGNQKMTAVTIKVAGPVNAADFKTMWEASLNGELRHLDLSEATAEGNRIPDNAFWDNDAQADGRMIKLESILLPGQLESIGHYAFSWAIALGDISLPRSITSLGNSCFSHCKSLGTTPLEIPEGVTEIPRHCFQECSSLTKVILPSSIRKIGAVAFYMTDLAEINFPDGLEDIGDLAFYGCLLKEVVLPSSCVNITGESVFAHNNDLESLYLSDGITSIPAAIAADSYRMTSLHIPASIVTINNSAFENCVSLGSADLPEGLVAIENRAFKGCHAIEELSLPSTLKILGQQTFSELPRLKRVYCEAPYPPMCREYISNSGAGELKGSFGEITDQPSGDATPRGIPVYVPVGSGDRYRGIWSWNYFTNIIETAEFPGSAATDEIDGTANATSIQAIGNEIVISATPGTAFSVFSIDGRTIAAGTMSSGTVRITLPSGVYMAKAGETVKKTAL